MRTPRVNAALLVCVGLGIGLGAGGACDAEVNDLEQEQLARSRESWSAVKAASGGRYRYVDSDQSFTGSRWRTTIEVQADEVVGRSYSRQDGSGAVQETWTEEGAALGSHAAGAPPLTIEEVYDGCASTVLAKNPNENLITLTFHPDGVLQTCTYFPKNCADDCAIGYRISSYELLN